MSVDLGDEVQDSVSGFRGISVSKHIYLQGCIRFSVQPKINKEGKLPDHQTFDEPQLKIITKNKVKQGVIMWKSGGPMPYIPKERYET